MASKILIKEIRPHVKLYRDPKTGIAWVEDGTAGVGYSAHPNIKAFSGWGSSGNPSQRVRAWAQGGRVVKSHGFLYNIDSVMGIENALDQVAAANCMCGGYHGSWRGGEIVDLVSQSGPRPHEEQKRKIRKAVRSKQSATRLSCAGMNGRDCTLPVTHVDNRGFVYCSSHGDHRRASGTPCRKMTRAEIKRLEEGGTISYSKKAGR